MNQKELLERPGTAQLDEAMEALEETTANGYEGCAAVAAAALGEKP